MMKAIEKIDKMEKEGKMTTPAAAMKAASTIEKWITKDEDKTRKRSKKAATLTPAGATSSSTRTPYAPVPKAALAVRPAAEETV